MTENFRIMRWWLNDETPADIWRVERRREDGIWTTLAARFTTREGAEVHIASLMTGAGSEFMPMPRKFPTLAVVAWTVAVGLAVYGLAFFLR